MPLLYGPRDTRLKLDRLAPPDDTDSLDATVHKHGLLPKLSGSASEFLNGSGGFATPSGTVPDAHATTHQDGGSDEISVAGLSGLLATAQTPAAHKASHQDGGSDEISVTGLSGLLADAQTPVGGPLASGVYTPTRSAEANLDANVTPSEAQYLRVGTTVTVSGRFTADPTTPATATSFELTLPVASNLGAIEDLAGVAFCGTIAGQGAAILGSVANNTAVIQWVAGDVTSQAWSYSFSYQII